MNHEHPAAAGHVRKTRQSIAIAGSDKHELMRLVVSLGEMGYSIIASESRDILINAKDLLRSEPNAIIVSLSGIENVVELRELLSTDASTKFLFLIPSMPPSAAMARLMNAHGAAVVARSDATFLVVTTLVALLAGGVVTH